MVKYRRIKNTRPKAFVGESIVAAGIGAAATLASAAISSAATTAGAKRQALAQSQAAQTQAEALKKQNDNANKLQEKQIEFTQKQNEQNRDLQNQIQMNLQMLAGQQNENERLDAARIQVKKGGSARRNNLSSFGFGIDGNMPFEVTDGGYAMPIGVTPQGYDLYELRGDNHEQYHKTRGGKYKSGVGIKVATGQTVEGEGGKRNAQGELIMVTPDDIKFISKHSLHGFNPTNAVLNGLDPQVAYNEQELIKAYDNSPVKKNKRKEGGPGITKIIIGDVMRDIKATKHLKSDVKRWYNEDYIPFNDSLDDVWYGPLYKNMYQTVDPTGYLSKRDAEKGNWLDRVNAIPVIKNIPFVGTADLVSDYVDYANRKKQNKEKNVKKQAVNKPNIEKRSNYVFADNEQQNIKPKRKSTVTPYYKVGGSTNVLFDLSNPINFSTDTIAPTVGGFEYLYNQQRQKQKCGGRVKKAYGGNYNIYNPYDFYNKYKIPQAELSNGNKAAINAVLGQNPYSNLNDPGPNRAIDDRLYDRRMPKQTSNPDSNKFQLSDSAELYAGAGLNTIGNVGASIINSIANKKREKWSIWGLNEATKRTIEGARQLHGINGNALKRSDFAAAHAMAALVDPRVNINPQLASVERASQRLREDIARNSRSGAAALNRYANLETNAYDSRSKIYSMALDKMKDLQKYNASNIQNTSLQNAAFDNEAGQRYLQSKLDLLKYNNDIANQKIGLEYGALANQATGIAGIKSGTIGSNAQTWSGTLANAGNTFANALMTNAKYKQDRQNVLLGASDESVSRYLTSNGTTAAKKEFLKRFGWYEGMPKEDVDRLIKQLDSSGQRQFRGVYYSI